MRSILVPLEDSESLSSVLETAYIVANHFSSYLEILHVRPMLTGIMATGMEGGFAATPHMEEAFEQEESERSRRAWDTFEAFRDTKHLPRSEAMAPADHPTVGWLEEVSPGTGVIGNRGRIFDLTIVGRPLRGRPAPSISTLEAALFESGHPILIAPPAPPPGFGKNIVIAWNGSNETARTVTFALPLLGKAENIHVLSIEEGMVTGPKSRDLVEYLLRRGIDASPIEVKSGDRSVGAAILEEATKLGADLLVKGAYTHSRLRQLIFGGPTSHILANAEIPVFMAH